MAILSIQFSLLSENKEHIQEAHKKAVEIFATCPTAIVTDIYNFSVIVDDPNESYDVWLFSVTTVENRGDFSTLAKERDRSLAFQNYLCGKESAWSPSFHWYTWRGRLPLKHANWPSKAEAQTPSNRTVDNKEGD